VPPSAPDRKSPKRLIAQRCVDQQYAQEEMGVGAELGRAQSPLLRTGWVPSLSLNGMS
jgi:hypothetical protein